MFVHVYGKLMDTTPFRVQTLGVTPEYRKHKSSISKATKNRKLDFDPSLEWTPFRAAEKRFKARFPLPDSSSDILDLAHGDGAYYCLPT